MKKKKNQRYNILYVDDDEQNLFLFKVTFKEYYNIITTTSSEEALSILERNTIHILFADQRMPDINGIQLLERARKISPDTIRIIITGYSDIDVAIDAINRGAVFKYVSKPWNQEDIDTSIKNAIEFYNLKTENKNLLVELNEQNKLLKKKVQELNFLNELNLKLRSITEKDSMTDLVVKNLSARLGAESGAYLSPLSDSLKSREGAPEEIDEATLSEKDFSIVPGKDNYQYLILPLWFQSTFHGAIYFKFAKPIDMLEAPFFKACSLVIASALHNFEVHRATLERERFFIIGQMASMLVHDLKNPINTILGFISILERDLDREEKNRYIEILKSEMNRLFELVNELLDFARGKQHLKIEKLDALKLIHRILDNYRIKFDQNHITCKVEIDREATLHADEGKMSRVIINLLDNAVDRLKTVETEKKISIRCGKYQDGSLIKIANSGPRIPDDYADKIFDPFFSTGKKNGTGLGLTICKKIVEEHSGSLRLNNTNGMTEFLIYIPFHDTLK